MASGVWLNSSDELVPGRELFSSDRNFTLWAFSPSMARVMLRNTSRSQHDGIRIDILFQVVTVLKIRALGGEGLRISCATEEEEKQIRAETPQVTYYNMSAVTGSEHDGVPTYSDAEWCAQ